MRRGAIYAFAGGLVTGTVLFGSPDTSIKRIISFYDLWVLENEFDKRGDGNNIIPGKI